MFAIESRFYPSGQRNSTCVKALHCQRLILTSGRHNCNADSSRLLATLLGNQGRCGNLKRVKALVTSYLSALAWPHRHTVLHIIKMGKYPSIDHLLNRETRSFHSVDALLDLASPSLRPLQFKSSTAFIKSLTDPFCIWIDTDPAFLFHYKLLSANVEVNEFEGL